MTILGGKYTFFYNKEQLVMNKKLCITIVP